MKKEADTLWNRGGKKGRGGRKENKKDSLRFVFKRKSQQKEKEKEYWIPYMI